MKEQIKDTLIAIAILGAMALLVLSLMGCKGQPVPYYQSGRYINEKMESWKYSTSNYKVGYLNEYSANLYVRMVVSKTYHRFLEFSTDIPSHPPYEDRIFNSRATVHLALGRDLGVRDFVQWYSFGHQETLLTLVDFHPYRMGQERLEFANLTIEGVMISVADLKRDAFVNLIEEYIEDFVKKQ